MPESHFIRGDTASLFLQAYGPEVADSAVARAVIVCPAFAEEMNRSRRTLHKLVVELGPLGTVLIIPDLGGTGDSGGEFDDVSVRSWCRDLQSTLQWVREQYPEAKVSLLGIRLGALLACSVAATGTLDCIVFWQPVINSRRFIKEFLRMWDIAQIAVTDKRSSAADRIVAEGMLEIGGYPLTARLTAEIEALDLAELWPPATPVHWFETGTALTAGSEKLLARLRAAGAVIDADCADAPPFWRIQEITVAHELVTKTAAIFRARHDT